MSKTATAKTHDEILKEMRAAHEERHALATDLLNNIKTQKSKIESLLKGFHEEEPDLVYRFYHKSYKVFIMNTLIEQAKVLF